MRLQIRVRSFELKRTGEANVKLPAKHTVSKEVEAIGKDRCRFKRSKLRVLMKLKAIREN